MIFGDPLEAAGLGRGVPAPPGSQGRPCAEPRRFGRGELSLMGLLFTLALCLRVVYVFHHGFDSDESQHLHVAWAWTQGLLPYRDVFDNHAPLFHLLHAPLVAAAGETPNILFLSRLTMLPWYLAALWSTFALGKSLYTARAGAWAALLVAVWPDFFFKSLEFRADDLWVVFWLLSLVVLLGGEWRGRRALAGGALLGAAVGTSLKSVMLISSLCGAALILPLLSRRMRERITPRRLAACLLLAALGACLVPAGLALYFAFRGALGPFLYGTFLHNVQSKGSAWLRPRSLLFLPGLALLIAGVRMFLGRARREEKDPRRALVATTAGIYYLWLMTLWPVVTKQDFLPLHPLVAVLAAGALAASPRLAAIGLSGRFPAALAGPAALMLCWLPLTSAPWEDHTGSEVRLLSTVLRLTEPEDFILDRKGETVFRRRPFFYVMESLTREGLDRGVIPDRIPEDLVATRTCVTVDSVRRFPPRASRFILENYISVGPLRVAGQRLDVPPPGRAPKVTFEVAVPARYGLVAKEGPVSGTLDGQPYLGPRFLAAGRHDFVAAERPGRLALVWAQALERGFSPFRPRPSVPPFRPSGGSSERSEHVSDSPPAGRSPSGANRPPRRSLPPRGAPAGSA